MRHQSREAPDFGAIPISPSPVCVDRLNGWHARPVFLPAKWGESATGYGERIAMAHRTRLVVAVALVALLGVGGFFLMRLARRPSTPA